MGGVDGWGHALAGVQVDMHWTGVRPAWGPAAAESPSLLSCLDFTSMDALLSFVLHIVFSEAVPVRLSTSGKGSSLALIHIIASRLPVFNRSLCHQNEHMKQILRVSMATQHACVLACTLFVCR